MECTVNRVGDQFFDQLERNGHAWREDDLERFAGLGLTALRYPILWERMAPDQAQVTDWSWADRRLNRLRELGLRPIVGLIHHGSGPRRTNLLAPDFAAGLADFARQVAERYPWIEDYTPVNEPLTTARFSALYGHWYPHTHDDRSFIRAFLNQCKGVALSMRAIRAVNPAARLLQTEDLGKTFSTAALAGQAEFENQRRWLTFDLLCGRIGEEHPLWGYLQEADAPEEDLAWFRLHPCPPEILGINYYVTSERFLDERLDRYPAYSYSHNQTTAYADMPAVRASSQGLSGAGRLLREAWERYDLPLAITEAQLNCTREEQMRWVAEIWREVRALRAREGVDVRAVTLWALLGSFNWTNLLTRDDPASYEPGVFDLRAPVPHPTALAALARTLAREGDTDHPVMDVPGWWRRPERFACLPAEAHQSLGPAITPGTSEQARPILIIGKGSALAHAFEVICRERFLPVRLLDVGQWNAGDADAGNRTPECGWPWAIIHAGDDPMRSDTLSGLPTLIFASDQNPVAALAHGQDKNPALLTVLSDVGFGPWDDADLVRSALRGVASGAGDTLPCSRPFSLSYLPDLVHASLDLLLDGATGMWHLSNGGTLNHRTFVACAAQCTGAGQPETQPGDVPPGGASTITRRSIAPPPWQSAL